MRGFLACGYNSFTMKRGLFITFEGPEGSGKSTHIVQLGKYLNDRGYPVFITREPGGTALSGHFRQILLETGEGLTALAELFLYEADRAQHVAEVIKPALNQRRLVLCDRYTDSTLAYQGFGRGLDLKQVAQLNAAAAGDCLPDLTILLDVPVTQGLRQARLAKNRHDRLEKAGVAFHERVRKGFLTIAKKEPRRFRVIKQQREMNETQARIREAVDEFLRERRQP
jgi:dTMP kinase